MAKGRPGALPPSASNCSSVRSAPTPPFRWTEGSSIAPCTWCTRRPLRAPRPPAYDAAELDGIVPSDLKKQYDVREAIARLVDASEFDEFKALY
ncbi:MAG: hypothetical protein IT356_10465, partial [Gemmatimonadaceae bacterium]|nr:hypothetical protein [Gemmatimonadaceae bacterium]